MHRHHRFTPARTLFFLWCCPSLDSNSQRSPACHCKFYSPVFKGRSALSCSPSFPPSPPAPPAMTPYLHPANRQYYFPEARLGLHSAFNYSVKQESRTPSPDLSAFQQFQFQFQPGSDHPRVQSHPVLNIDRPVYRFGPDSPPVSSNPWPSGSVDPDAASMQHTVSFDEFEDPDELSQLSSMIGLHVRSGSGTGQDKTVRRRSSKGASIYP